MPSTEDVQLLKQLREIPCPVLHEIYETRRVRNMAGKSRELIGDIGMRHAIALYNTVKKERPKTVLEVGKTEGGDTFARDASRPLVFTVDTTLQGDFTKSFDDYRKKELLELRPFYVTRLRAVLDAPGGPKTYEFEKVKADKPTDTESWKVTRVGGASHTADAAAMDDLLAKLVALKAESFVDAKTKTGLDKPALVISASFDEGKFERVRFGRVDEEAYGSREGEAVIAKVDRASMAAAMQAFDKVVIPPEPAPPAADKAGEKK